MGRLIEVTPKNDVVWEFIRPYQGSGSPGIPQFIGSVYRAYRIPYDWVPKNPKNQ